MPHERRLSVRKTPERLTYLSLPFNNGGIVIDISEGGLGFNAIAPVKVEGPIHFRFAIDSGERIRAVGESAWKDETGKMGGLRFTQLPDEIREQIRAWTGQSKAKVLEIPVAEPAIETETAPGEKGVLAPVADVQAAPLAIEAQCAPSSNADLTPVAAIRNPLLYNFKPPIYSAPFYKLSMFPLEPDMAAGATAFAMLQSVAARRPIAAVGLTIALAFLVSTGIFTYVSASRRGKLLFDWGEELWRGFSSQPNQRDPAPPSVNSAPVSSRTTRP